MMAGIVIIKETYYTKVFMGKGDLTSEVPSPELGYFYVNATNGTAKVFDGSAWNNLSTGVVIAI